MSDHDNGWNPEDGPPPTEEEIAEARAVSEALGGNSRKRGQDADVDALVEVALRVRATAHPDAERSKAVAADAVNEALSRADARWYRSRWRWAALVAAAVVGMAGIQLAQFRPLRDDALPSISRPAGREFGAALPNDARSMPIGRITDARMRSYRNIMLHGGAGR